MGDEFRVTFLHTQGFAFNHLTDKNYNGDWGDSLWRCSSCHIWLQLNTLPPLQEESSLRAAVTYDWQHIRSQVKYFSAANNSV